VATGVTTGVTARPAGARARPVGWSTPGGYCVPGRAADAAPWGL